MNPSALQTSTASVLSVAYGPCFRRRLWTYAVACPRGHGVHLHRGGPPRPDGHHRTAPCGAEYTILVRTVLPAMAVGEAA